MPRQVGSGLKAWGISNTLRSLKFDRSERINPKDRKDKRMSAGFRADQVDERTVSLKHDLGNKHGITTAKERNARVEEFLGLYQEALKERFVLTKVGEGEFAYLVVRELPNPAVGEALRQAADRFFKMGDAVASDSLRRWADFADQGEEW